MAHKYRDTCIMVESHVTPAHLYYLSSTGLQLLLGRYAMCRDIVYLHVDLHGHGCATYHIIYGTYSNESATPYPMQEQYMQEYVHTATRRG